MATFVLDCAYGRPDASWAKRSEYSGILRYLCDTPGKPGKKTDSDEVNSYLEAGLAVGCIWQETHDALIGGEQAGKTDGAKAREAMEALGAPKKAAVYFCADAEHVTADHATAYLKAARDELGPYALGLYGGIDVITGVQKAMDGVYLWQTAAWSTDRIADDIHLYQHSHRASAFGFQIDVNTAYKTDWGQFTKIKSR